MGKYIGIDYGIKKIGIAISDEDTQFAFPYRIVKPEGIFQEIQTLVNENDITGVVIGKSVATNGKENTLHSSVEMLAKKIEQYAPVFFEQEMFSSVEAHRYQTKAGERDDSAAAIILQRFLDKKQKEV